VLEALAVMQSPAVPASKPKDLMLGGCLAYLVQFLIVPFRTLPPAIPPVVRKARRSPAEAELRAVRGRGGSYPAAAAGAGERPPTPASPVVLGRIGDGLNPLTMRSGPTRAQ
jgi:hypothetical protein